MSLTTKKSSLESSTQLIDCWMEQNLGVQENRNAGGMPQEVTSNLSAPTRIRYRISRTQEKGTKSRSLPALSTTEPAPGSILVSDKRWLDRDLLAGRYYKSL